LVAKCAEEIFDAMDILYECSQKYNLPLTQGFFQKKMKSSFIILRL